MFLACSMGVYNYSRLDYGFFVEDVPESSSLLIFFGWMMVWFLSMFRVLNIACEERREP